ncbi:SGNH/GDSL hydrolase family protein [Microbacterium forte]|uniref:SGNH/GDSL hydrolase family protein n=1 Tax=Microbacterium forte TaxID=2982533 RepID=UPI002892E359|nr:SGNH/GDSL hydrolase family protein [Microbacterium sp. A(2022)]
MTYFLTLTDALALDETGRRAIAKDFVSRTEVSRPGVTATFKAPVFNAESPALLTIRQKVMRAMLGRDTCSLLVTADSKSSEYLGTVVSWPTQLRRLLDALEGFVQADNGVMDARWTSAGMSPSPTTSIGLQPTTAGSTATKSVTFTGTVTASGAKLLARIPGGGAATLTINGTSQAITIPAVSGFHAIDLAGIAPGPLTVTIAATADLYVAGIRLSYSTPGLIISNPARPSSAASDWSPGGSTGRWSTIVAGPATDPDFVISALGTNEITNLFAITTYYDALAARGVPVIIVNPGGLGGARTRVEAEALSAHLYSIAQARDWPLIDFEAVIGTYDQALAHLLMLDTLHENSRAALLEALAVYALIFGGLT